jgi:hypothetical protein
MPGGMECRCWKAAGILRRSDVPSKVIGPNVLAAATCTSIAMEPVSLTSERLRTAGSEAVQTASGTIHRHHPLE